MFRIIGDSEVKKVFQYITAMRHSHSGINRLLSNLEQHGDLILIGGAIRDIAINGRQPRDFDIIVNSDDDIGNAFSNIPYHVNRFGGYKLSVGQIKFDIWSLKDNWAFREGHLKPMVENIKDGTFFDVDSVLINLADGYWDATFYNESMKSKRLNIVLNEELAKLNPLPEVNILRAFVLQDYYQFQFSDRLVCYIQDWLESTHASLQILERAVARHYGGRRYEDITGRISSWCRNPALKR